METGNTSPLYIVLLPPFSTPPFPAVFLSPPVLLSSFISDVHLFVQIIRCRVFGVRPVMNPAIVIGVSHMLGFTGNEDVACASFCSPRNNRKDTSSKHVCFFGGLGVVGIDKTQGLNLYIVTNISITHFFSLFSTLNSHTLKHWFTTLFSLTVSGCDSFMFPRPF